MNWLFLGTIYGIGFGITLIGGTLYLLLLNGKASPLKVAAAIVGWPITCGVIAYNIWRG
jgi:hypothetical protein